MLRVAVQTRKGRARGPYLKGEVTAGVEDMRRGAEVAGGLVPRRQSLIDEGNRQSGPF